MTISYAVEVIADSTRIWVPNQVRVPSRAQAEAYALEMAQRWSLVRETRVVESTDPVNYTFVDRLRPTDR